jgi:ABC-type phosphate transport system substrate-binding protein
MNFSSFNRGLALTTAALALSTSGAFAATPVNVYAGGSTLSMIIDRAAMDCIGTPIASETTYTTVDCNGSTTGAALANGFEYYYAAIGSGGGLANLLAEADGNQALGGNAPTAVDGNIPNSSRPYPHWHLTFSDAPLDSIPSDSNTTTYLTTYLANLKTSRGQAWQYPVAATTITVPFNPGIPSAGSACPGTSGAPAVSLLLKNQSVICSGGVMTTTGGGTPTTAGTAGDLNLTNDQLCYLWTGRDAKGNTPSGTWDWSNPILTQGTFKANKAHTQIDPAAYAGLYPTSASSLPITLVHRNDGSGSTFIFTSYLDKHCKGYGTAGYGTPTNDPGVFPSTTPGGTSFVTNKGSGGMITSVNATVGAVGYVTPDQVAPTPGKTTTAAYLATPSSTYKLGWHFVYSSPATIQLSVAGVQPPAANAGPKKWGAKLNAKYFKKTNNPNGYPITSLTWMMGYQCYVEDTVNGEIETAVSDYLTAFYKTDSSNGSSATVFDNIITSQGMLPLPDTYKAAINATFAGGGKYSLVGVPTTYADTSKKNATGPKQCKLWNNAGSTRF